MKLHGRVINYSDINNLPDRTTFLDSKKKSEIDTIINEGKSLPFIPASICENSLPDDHTNKYSKWRYKLIMFGTLPDGRSVTVVVNGIEPYVYVRIPNKFQNSTVNRYLFKSQLESELNIGKIAYEEIQIIQKKEFLGFDKSAYFLKIIFSKTTGKGRGDALKLIHQKRWKTATDDRSGYYKVPVRDNKITVSSWLKLEKYKVEHGTNSNTQDINSYFKDELIFQISIDNVKPYTEKEILNNASLAQDHTMVMGWDIECASKSGALPVPTNDDDIMFMICMDFQWHFAKTQLLRVCLVDHPTDPHPDFLTIVCKNEKNIIKAFAEMFEKMTPEYTMGFNDTGFDWPWFVARAWKYSVQSGENLGDGVIEFVAQKMDRIVQKKHYYRKDPYNVWFKREKKRPEFKKKYNNENLKTPANAYLSYVISDYKKEKIKIDAETYVDAYFLQYRGCIMFDVMTIFRQLHPTAEKNSLNYFLGLYNLGSKKEMEIPKMFKIYWDMDRVMKQKEEEKHESQDSANLLQHLKSKMAEVAEYCVIDSRYCPELTRVRNVIPDRREVANLSFVSIYDAFYRAGGMKMRNIVIAEGQDRGYVFSTVSQKKISDNKFPGAMVLNPKTGLFAPKLTLRERVEKHKEFVKEKGCNFSEEGSLRTIPHADLMSITDRDTKIEMIENAIIESNSSGNSLTELDADRIISDARERYVHENEEKGETAKNWDLDTDIVFKNYLMESTSRPVTGLDFSSLYPHLIMTYNFSPEFMITKETCGSIEKMANVIKKAEEDGFTLYEIKFKYGAHTVRGFSIRHDNLIDVDNPNSERNRFGIYPTVLKKMYDKRSILKKPKQYYEMLIEHFEKLNDDIRKNNKIVQFIQNKRDLFDAIQDWDGLIEQEDSFGYAKLLCEENEKSKEWLLNLGEKELLTSLDKNYAVDFIHKKIKGSESKETVEKILNYEGDDLKDSAESLNIDDMERLFAYYHSKQLALKIMMNTLYGESGNKISPFYVLALAGGITTAGRYNLGLVRDLCLKKGCGVVYGDSVTGDTPILYKSETYDKFVNIEDLFDEKRSSKLLDKEIFVPEDKFVWSDKGFTKIKQVIRHKTKKQLYRILTHTGIVDVTEDHSLLDKDGNKIKPTECKVGTELLHRDLPQTEVDLHRKDIISKEEAYAYGLFMADGSCGIYSTKWGIKYSWAINNQNKDYLNKANEGMKKYIHCKKFKILNTMESSGVYKLVPSGNGKGCFKLLVENFRKMFYYGKTKIVPTTILQSSYKIQEAFLRGYYDGDGDKTSNYNKGKSFDEYSKRFDSTKDVLHLYVIGKIGAATMFKLCNNLGYNCSINCRTDKPNILRLTISKKSHRKNTNTIKKIIPLGEVEDYVYDLETENHHFAAGVGRLIVHNTDSVYITVPEQCFKNIDNAYFGNQISKLQYCNQLINCTIREIKKINKYVNEQVANDNGTQFLRLAYEEVLFPIVMLSKKKYYGLPHISVPNFNIDRAPFVRGIESKKRGSSNILRDVYNNQIMTKSLSIYNKKELMELVYEAINYFYEKKWDMEDFVQTAIYKPKTTEEVLLGKGNVKVLTFVDRMTDRGIEIKPHQRFKYVITKKYPNKHDYRGRTSELKVGERMELLHIVEKNNMPIDKDYYMKGSIIAQLARVMIYRPEFYIKPINNSDTEIKKANERMIIQAKNHLTAYITNNGFYDLYHNIGPIKQRIFKKASDIIFNKLDEKFNDNTFENVSQKVLFRDWGDDVSESFDKIYKMIDRKAKKDSANYGDKLVKFIKKESKKRKDIIMNRLHSAYGNVTGGQYFQIANFKDRNIEEIKNRFRVLFKDLITILEEYKDTINIMSDIVDDVIYPCYKPYLEPMSAKESLNFDDVKRMDIDVIAGKINKKIPYDILNDIAEDSIISMENKYKLREIVEELGTIQDMIYAVLSIYYKTESISDAIIIHNDAKNNIRNSLFDNPTLVRNHRDTLIAINDSLKIDDY